VNVQINIDTTLGLTKPNDDFRVNKCVLGCFKTSLSRSPINVKKTKQPKNRINKVDTIPK
ncbi:hypothetical protein OFN62_37095, partial [Escherichia coli]|nr:hypothetical protein [Escherichia coli]